MADIDYGKIKDAEVSVGLQSIGENATRYQGASAVKVIIFVVALATLLTTSILLFTSDQSLTARSIYIIAAVQATCLMVLVFTYLSYLRGFGRYVFSRLRPLKSA